MTSQTTPDITLTPVRLRAGVWEGILAAAPGSAAPAIEVMHMERPVGGATVTTLSDRPGQWALRVPIPAEAISDGVQTFLIRHAGTGETLASFAVLAGTALEQDIRAEVDLLRAELDMLKRAFRRHCLDTMG
ncbi:hypothetical protein [Ruixingdingia sedimenti]|uniref:Uncharacterized protein n=1 Tax=Ruixingdingia sedimenti TaxID=3073604 RepID=A0ABU1F2B4_9RHOB|nr:hypothetical protein [Xinfangfangia sp. LG-4]MDR5651007.1 hypothetical protein [Xinfangfangia sp. LG-4]